MSAPKLLIAGMFGYFALALVPARADISLVFAITSDHCSNPLTGLTAGCTTGAANMGTITVSQTNAEALIDEVSVHAALLPGFGFVSTGAGNCSGCTAPGSFFFRLLGNPTITYSGIPTGWSVPGGSAPSQSAGSYAGDGLKKQFEYALACHDGIAPDACGNGGSSPASNILDFKVTATGLTPAAFNDTGNASGSPFAADVLSTTGNTGLVDASLGRASVPEPTTFALLGGVLLFVARTVRKRLA